VQHFSWQALFTAREADGGNSSAIGALLTFTVAQCMDDISEWNRGSGVGASILVVGATNEPWALDAALLRKGRFDKAYFVGPLDPDGRMQFLQTYWDGCDVEIDERIDLQVRMCAHVCTYITYVFRVYACIHVDAYICACTNALLDVFVVVSNASMRSVVR
jgi:hypothetical protein